MKVTMTLTKDYAPCGEPLISQKGGARIRTSFWAPEPGQSPLLAVIENWHSDSVPLWVLATGVRWVHTDLGLLDTHKELDRTDHLGGSIPPSFAHDFARLGLAEPGPRVPTYEVTP